MNWQTVNTPPHFRYHCVGCGKHTDTLSESARSNATWADLDGPSFVFWCQPCAAEAMAKTAPAATRYKVWVIADSSGKWCTNGRDFATEAEANAYGIDLCWRWTAVREWEVRPV